MPTISDRIPVMRSGIPAGEISFDDACKERMVALAACEQADPSHPEVRRSGYASASMDG